MPDVHAKRSPSHAAIWSVCWVLTGILRGLGVA